LRSSSANHPNSGAKDGGEILALRFAMAAFPKQKYLDDASRLIWRQLVRAVSSSTFNFEEAQAASSDADFLAKMTIALREARETRIAIRTL
jgi:four helix bundle protein